MWFSWIKDPTTNFPYEIGDIVTGLEEKSFWVLHKGKRKSNGEPVSVFQFEGKLGKEDVIERPKLAVKRCKTLRHPNVLTFIDSHETDKAVCMVTEPVIPVDKYLESISHYTVEQKRLAISWGLYQVSKGLAFLINDCNLNHNNIFHASIFVNNFGNWKIGGFEYVTPTSDSNYPNKKIAYLDRYLPPEMKLNNSSSSASKWSNDSYGLGCLIWESFNGPLPSPESLRSHVKIPKQLVPLYTELIASNPSKRLSPWDFITKARSAGGFMKNSFIDAMLFLEELQIKEPNEKNRFFNNLDSQIDSFPSDACKNKILPLLISAFEYGSTSGPGSAAPVLGPLFKIATALDDTEYERKVVPCIVKLFSSKDRATRAKLLSQSEKYVKHLTKNVINDQVYPQVAQGFIDSNATIREHTIKAMVHFAPKLNYANLNEDLLQHFARLQQRDEEGVIRTNSVVCLGKIAAYLHPSVRQNVLINSFLRAMRDPFPPARINGILALSATQSFFSLKETAQRVMPALCYLTIDPEKAVRDQAFKTLKGFLGKMEKVSEDPSLAEKMEADLNKSGSEATGSANLTAGWASWAVTSLTSKFYRSKSTSSAPSNAISFSSAGSSSSSSGATVGVTSTTALGGTTGQSKSEHSSRPCSKQASEDSDVWGKMESMDDDEVKSQASKGDWDADGWENEDEVLETTSTSNCDLEGSTKQQPLPPHQQQSLELGESKKLCKDGPTPPSSKGGRKGSSSNGWEDEFTENMWTSWGLNEPNIKTTSTSSSGPSVIASSNNSSSTSSEVNKKCPNEAASEQFSSTSVANESTTRGRKTTPGVTKKQGPLKLGAKKIS